MSSSLNPSTCLLICGNNLEANLITEKLGFSPNAVTRKGEIILHSLKDGAPRAYDIRLGLDCWKRTLSSKQHTFNLVKQLGFWIEKLYPVRSAFQ